MVPSRPRKKKSRRGSHKRPAVRMLSPARVPAAVQAMAAPVGTARFAAGKALSLTAARDPGRVYPYFDVVAALLESESKIVRWNAIQIIASLAQADSDRKLDALLDTYLAFIRGGNLISAANAIQGAGRIVRSRPDLLDRLIPAILGVERAAYETAECRNVAVGQVLGVLSELWSSVRRRPDVAKFVRRQKANTRTAVARQAERMAADLS